MPIFISIGIGGLSLWLNREISGREFHEFLAQRSKDRRRNFSGG